MLADFDWLIGIGILIAIALSKEPKWSAIVFILFVLTAVKAIDVYVEAWDGWLSVFLATILEAAAAICIILKSMQLPEIKDKQFFWLMAIMLWLSSLLGFAYLRIGLNFYGNYIFISEIISIIHLLAMLSFSDGIRNFIGSVRDSFITSRGSTAL